MSDIPKVIQVDTWQKHNQKHHQAKEKWFEDHGWTVVRSKMLVGDYCIPSNGSVSVDSKQNLQELYADLIQSHVRFREEADLAVKAGIKLYILIEEPNMTCLEDVKKWQNKRYLWWHKVNNMHKYGKMLDKKIPKKPPVDNITFLKIMSSFAKEHGVEYVFCKTEEAGEKIIEILTGANDG